MLQRTHEMETAYIAPALAAAWVTEPAGAKVTLCTDTRIEPQQQTLLVTLPITRIMMRWLVNYKLQMMWRELIMVQFDVLFWHGLTEENRNQYQPAYLTRYDTRISIVASTIADQLNVNGSEPAIDFSIYIGVSSVLLLINASFF